MASHAVATFTWDVEPRLFGLWWRARVSGSAVGLGWFWRTFRAWSREDAERQALDFMDEVKAARDAD